MYLLSSALHDRLNVSTKTTTAGVFQKSRRRHFPFQLAEKGGSEFLAPSSENTCQPPGAVDSDSGAQNMSSEIAVGPCEQERLVVLIIFDSHVELDNQAIPQSRIRQHPRRSRSAYLCCSASARQDQLPALF